MQKAVPVFVWWMDLGVVIHDHVGEREVVGEVSCCVTGVLAEVRGDECVLGKSSQFRLFHCHIVCFDGTIEFKWDECAVVDWGQCSNTLSPTCIGSLYKSWFSFAFSL